MEEASQECFDLARWKRAACKVFWERCLQALPGLVFCAFKHKSLRRLHGVPGEFAAGFPLMFMWPLLSPEGPEGDRKQPYKGMDGSLGVAACPKP